MKQQSRFNNQQEGCEVMNYKCDRCGACGFCVEPLDGIDHRIMTIAYPSDDGLTDRQFELAREGRLAWVETCGKWRVIDPEAQSPTDNITSIQITEQTP